MTNEVRSPSIGRASRWKALLGGFLLLLLMSCQTDQPLPDGDETSDASVGEQVATLVSPAPAQAERFGASVAIWGDALLVGAPGRGTPELDHAGAAYLFERSQDGAWLAEQTLTTRDAKSNANFGHAVAMAEGVIVIGAPFQSGDGSTGGASIFERQCTGCEWVEQARLAPEGEAGIGLFGAAVATDGSRVVVGAFEMGARAEGSVLIYSKQNGSWSLEASVSASDRRPYAQFGISVAIAGDTLLVGAAADDTQGLGAGAAYVFVYREGQWAEQAKLLASHGDDFDFFGTSVAIERDTAVIGAHTDEGSDGTSSSGAMYVFSRNGEDWREQARLVPADNRPGDSFGISVALAGEMLVAGAYQNSDKGRNSGAMYIFQRVEGSWDEVRKVYREEAAAEEEFGYWVDVSEEGFVVGGAPGVDAPVTDAGAAYLIR